MKNDDSSTVRVNPLGDRFVTSPPELIDRKSLHLKEFRKIAEKKIKESPLDTEWFVTNLFGILDAIERRTIIPNKDHFSSWIPFKETPEAMTYTYKCKACGAWSNRKTMRCENCDSKMTNAN